MDEKIEIIASGRTDAGVHAYKQVANFKTISNHKKEDILRQCYKYLPLDIVIVDIDEVPEKFHSRFHVKKKSYLYKIYNHPYHNVFTRKYSYHISEPINLERIKNVSKIFIGQHDFKHFSKTKSKKKSTVREIFNIDFVRNGPNIEIVFEGNGFLYKMVRILVGVLIEVGRGKVSYDDVENMLIAGSKDFHFDTAPSCGLYLIDVQY